MNPGVKDSMADEKQEPKGDRVFMGPALEDGGIPFVRANSEDHSLRGGIARVVRDGQPIPPNAELVCLDHVEGNEYRVKESVYGPSKGPPTVSTAAYRSGWEEVFGKKTKPDVAN